MEMEKACNDIFAALLVLGLKIVHTMQTEAVSELPLLLVSYVPLAEEEQSKTALCGSV